MDEARAGPGPALARVLPDVSGFQKELDYLVPASLAGEVRVGSIVRAPLQGRRVRAWVTACPDEPAAGVTLRPLTKVTSWGPEPEVVDLARWAAWRWWGRPRAFLATASPPVAVPVLPGPRTAGPDAGPGGAGARPGGAGTPLSWAGDGPEAQAVARSWTGGRPEAQAVARSWAGDGPEAQAVAEAWRPGPQVVRLPPTYRAVEVVMAAAGLGRPLLVVAPTIARAQAGHAALGRRGLRVALLPGDWAQARAGGADVVIGPRAACWGPCPALAGVVVLDAHDESLAQEQVPTWDAVTVAAERARRAGAPCLLVSACPTLELLALGGDHPHTVPAAHERRGWAALTVVDTRAQDPAFGLYPPPVVEALRGPGRVACILNRKGRAQLLACSACATTASCERCGAAVQLDVDQLVCRRCGQARPVVCLGCGSVKLKALRVGVSRVREQVEALAGRPTGEVTEATRELPPTPVLVATESLLYRESALHRAGGVQIIVFLDLDQELLAPRYRAGEEALALLARASRLVGGRGGGGRLLVETRLPGHPVLEAVLRADPSLLTAAERAVRRDLRLPPYGALAHISGPGAPELVGQLSREQLGAGGGEGAGAGGGGGEGATEAGYGYGLRQSSAHSWAFKARDYSQLADALAGLDRPAQRVRVEVGPVRA